MIYMNKKMLIITMASLLLFFGVEGCNDCEDSSDVGASTNPSERIVGSWRLLKVNEDDKSSQNIIWTFCKDGTWESSDIQNELIVESDSASQMMVSNIISFEEDWAYDIGNDAVSGYMDLFSPSTMHYPYRFILKKRELQISFEPREWYNVTYPSSFVFSFIRIN